MIRYRDVSVYQRETTDTLMRDELQNNLFFQNIRLGLNRGSAEGMEMCAVRDDAGGVLACAIRTYPFPMLLYEAGNRPDDAALSAMAQGFLRQEILPDFIMAHRDTASRFIGLYGDLTGRTFHLEQSMMLYKLANLIWPENLPAGSFRPGGERDMFYLPYWYADFSPACGIGAYELNGGIKKAGGAVDGGTVFIWEDGRPVSMAAHVRDTGDSAFIGMVYTPPHLRGRGYATACVAGLSRRLLSEGHPSCALYADCANPHSNKIYRSLGYEEISVSDQFRIDE